jgi:triacylglycerol lipase|tara:strand:+ start:4046 stop:4735 length:690 start_codon:yes stop_codon:yes gene_type:complete
MAPRPSHFKLEFIMSEYLEHYTGLRRTKRYDAKTALSMAVLCDLAYRNGSAIKAGAKQLGFDSCDFINVRKAKDIDTQCFIAGNEQDIVVVFRGSDDVNDWFANFQAVHDPGPLTKTHEGFQDALFPSVIQVTNSIDHMNDNEQRIWVTGHSLGGALCSLYAAMMFEAGYTVYGIYTFASPRPGDDALATALDHEMMTQGKGPHHRVMNEKDVVPHLPPEPFLATRVDV